MAQYRPLSRTDFARDWIDGVSPGSFVRRVDRRLARIRASEPGCRRSGALILEADPVRFAASFLACVHAGVPVLTGNPRWRRAEFEALAAVFRPGLVFGRRIRLPEPPAAADLPPPEPGAILVPTGGSTAGLRFAVHDWSTLTAHVEGFRGSFGGGAIDCCCVLPLFHVSGLMQVVRSLVSGGRIAFPAFADLLERRLPGFSPGSLCLSLVPAQLQRLTAQRRVAERLARARCIFVGGAPASGQQLERARRFGLPVVISYGLTETASMVTALPPDEFLAGHASAGRPLAHARVRVVGARGKACAAGTPGRIEVAGGSLFRGFLGGPARRGRWYRSGDEGFVDGDGRLHVIGRADRIVVTRGEKVDPLEVEAVLRESGAAGEVLVTGWPHPEWGAQLVAFYRPGGIRSDPVLWERELRRELAHYKIPRVLVEVDRLPLDGRGKLDRAQAARLLERDRE